MVVINDKRKCTGCGSCFNICPKNAIKLVDDNDGFWYPKVDNRLCVNCGLCEKSCPFNNSEIINRRKIFDNLYYSAQLKNKDDLSFVSSGGAAFGIAKAIIENGGVVYGVTQIGVDVIKHIRVESIEDLLKIRRSKYFQSSTEICYKEAKKDLDKGRLVFFTGVGCQIAGLRAFLKKEYDNLLTADVVCHGVPSRKVWNAYRKSLENENKDIIRELIFRDKSAGWENNQYVITFCDGKIIKEKSVDNPFHRGYLLGLYSRPSCGDCKFNLIPRVTDFTFADYWQYDGNEFKETRSLGISLICINTQKGLDHIEYLSKHVDIVETTEQKALDSARHLNNTPEENANRDRLLSELTNDNFNEIWIKYIKERKPSIIKRILKKIKRYLI